MFNCQLWRQTDGANLKTNSFKEEKVFLLSMKQAWNRLCLAIVNLLNNLFVAVENSVLKKKFSSQIWFRVGKAT